MPSPHPWLETRFSLADIGAALIGFATGIFIIVAGVYLGTRWHYIRRYTR